MTTSWRLPPRICPLAPAWRTTSPSWRTSKAWTAASFRTGTLALDTLIEEGGLSRSLRDVPGALILGGGVPVEAAGSIVGAVGVSGAPGPDIDEECALAGVEAVADQLEF